MTFEDAVNAHAGFLEKSAEEARQAILDFLGWDAVVEGEFAKDVRIVLVSAEFSKEVTSTAIWLDKKGVDLRCVRVKPYRLGDRVLLDIQQILPLPETASYQVQLKKKEEEERHTRESNNDFTKYDLVVKGKTHTQLTKRKLLFLAVQALIQDGIKVEQIKEFLPKRMWLWVDGTCDHEEFTAKVAELKTAQGNFYKLGHYYTQDDELFHVEGKTLAFTKHVGVKALSRLDNLIKQFPASGIEYCKSAEE
jgi:hypothetical protein